MSETPQQREAAAREESNRIIAIALIVLFGILALTIPILAAIDRQASIPIVASTYLGLATMVGIIWRVVRPIQKQIATIQKQTNGELHRRDNKIDELTDKLIEAKVQNALLVQKIALEDGGEDLLKKVLPKVEQETGPIDLEQIPNTNTKTMKKETPNV